MSNVVYLKKDDGEITAYDKIGLFGIRVYKNECETKEYADIKDINWSIVYDYQNESFDCEKSEFDEALNNFKNNLNLISEKL